MPGGFAKYGSPVLTPNTGTGGPFVPTSTVDTDGTMAANSDARIPSQKAVVTYVAANVAGLLDYRGTYDASTNLYPATGGSGVAGAVLKGDAWAISVAGTLGGTAVAIGDFVVAEVDTPAQTAANWGILEHDLGFTPAPIASPVFTTQATAPMFVASGLTGAVAASRYVGATASLAPVSGTFAVGDFVVTQAGNMWVCTVAGSPGTWVQPGASTYAPIGTPMFPLTGVIYNPATAASASTTSSTFADVSTANLIVTGTVSATGKLRVILEGVVHTGASATYAKWNLRTGGSDVAGTGRIITNNASSRARLRASIDVTGLTPGAGFSYTWGHSSQDNTNTAIIEWGQSSVGWGPAVMEVYAIP